MSLKLALLQVKQEKKDKDITARIQAMIREQQRLLDEGCINNTVNKDGDITKVKKEWNENVITDGGISYYKLNDKWYKVSVCDGDNDIILKFRFKDAIGRWVSVSAKSIKDAQSVVDDIFGKHKYTVSACRV